MAVKIFISYRHVEPDSLVASGLAKHFGDVGFECFLDTQIRTGMDWVKEIERQIRGATHFVVLLSSESLLSDMVRQEIVLAHGMRQAGRMSILPVRVAFDEPLPYDLGAYLGTIQWTRWEMTESVADLAARLRVDILAAPVEPAPSSQADSQFKAPDVLRESRGAPLPSADPRLVMETGTVRVSSPFYVRRSADGSLESAVHEVGVTCVIKGPRQSGKSSILARTRAVARRSGVQCAYVDLQNFDAQQLSSLDSLLLALAESFGEQMKASRRPADGWDTAHPKYSIKHYIEQALLDSSKDPIVLCLDEVDRIFDYEYRDDFFLALRGWHNERAINEPWERVNLFLAHATDPVLWIQDLNTSPFNVGEHYRLDPFSIHELQVLNSLHGEPISDGSQLRELHRLTGGQPYLARRALFELTRRGCDLAELSAVAADERGPFGDHLRGKLWAIRNEAKLRESFGEILAKRRCTAELDFRRLEAAGLVEGEFSGRQRPACELYERYFVGRL